MGEPRCKLHKKFNHVKYFFNLFIQVPFFFNNIRNLSKEELFGLAFSQKKPTGNWPTCQNQLLANPRAFTPKGLSNCYHNKVRIVGQHSKSIHLHNFILFVQDSIVKVLDLMAIMHVSYFEGQNQKVALPN